MMKMSFQRDGAHSDWRGNICVLHVARVNMYSPHAVGRGGHYTNALWECAPQWHQEECPWSENRAAGWLADTAAAENLNHDIDAFVHAFTTCFMLIHVFMHHLDTRRPQGCKCRGVKSTPLLKTASQTQKGCCRSLSKLKWITVLLLPPSPKLVFLFFS